MKIMVRVLKICLWPGQVDLSMFSDGQYSFEGLSEEQALNWLVRGKVLYHGEETKILLLEQKLAIKLGIIKAHTAHTLEEEDQCLIAVVGGDDYQYVLVKRNQDEEK